MKPSIIHLATLALVLLLGTQAAPAENRVALVIGQSALSGGSAAAQSGE
jgi:hypothetical protein